MDRAREAEALLAKTRALPPQARLHDLRALFYAPSGDPTFANDLERIQAELNVPSGAPWER